MTAVLKNLGLGLFTLFDIIEDPLKSFCFRGLYQFISIILEIKIEKLNTIDVLSKITKIRLLWIDINSIFLQKITVLSKRNKYVVSRVVVFDIFTNLFNVWLNRRQVDSHTCFCIVLLQNLQGMLVRE